MNELVLFGVTGDLAQQKIIPALYNLYKSGKIDRKTSFVGFGRKKLSKIDFQNFVEQVVKSKIGKGGKDLNKKIGRSSSTGSDNLSEVESLYLRDFSSQWSYIESEINNKNGYIKLAGSLSSNKTIVYLSLPPALQYEVCGLLVSAGILNKKNNRRLAIEKPYGFDSVSAKKLEEFLDAKIRQDQILRIDHYAGKQVLVELEQVARQGVFADIATNKHIEKIEIHLNESIDVSVRGSFYDGVGALNDICQNHVLHMLADVLAMPELNDSANVLADASLGSPAKSSAKSASLKSASLKNISLSDLRAEALSVVDLKNKIILGQYENFNTTQGVNPESKTETFFHIFAQVQKTRSSISKRWSGTKIELIGGKALKKADASITFIPKDKKKKPVILQINKAGLGEAYEQVLVDCFTYNADRFINFTQIQRSWKLVELVKKNFRKNKGRLVIYKKGARSEDIV